jgi:predicted short-subunit dehydrogenase-like oxidoreductase (DUF2520 family)
MKPADRPRLGFIGAGVVGTVLSGALAGAGYPVAAVYSRNAERRAAAARGARARAVPAAQDVADQADVVFLTVPDDAIVAVAGAIRWSRNKAVVHCNGAASLDLLAGPRSHEAAVGAFHPLQSFATEEQARRNLPGSAIAIDASTEGLLADLETMAVALGGRPLALHGDRAVYHLSAAIASNYLVTLLDLAAGLWGELGLSKEEGLRALLPLVRGTVENLDRVGLPAALTGPIARGDVGTVERHLAVLDRVAPEARAMYKELARRTIPIALAKGRIDAAAARRLATSLGDGQGDDDACE